MRIETEKIGMRSKSNGSSGRGLRSWLRTKKRPMHAEAASMAAIAAGSRSCEKPSIEAINRPNVRALSSASRQSKRRPSARTGFAGRNRPLSVRATSPIGMLTAKSQGHGAVERMAAASVGPATEATATTVALIPMPRPSCARG